MKPSVDSAGGHHLLKHTAPSIERVVECFDGAPVKEISKLIMRMGQRELQAKFNAVYGTVTRSNNNDWLRRKLFESIGVKSSNKSKPAAKRDSKVGPAKANRVLKVTKPTTSRSSWSSPGDSTAPYSLPPPESPATVTHGDGSQTHTPFCSQVSALIGAQQVSAASAESGYMSGASTMHARPYPIQRVASAPQPAASGHHPAGPVGCGPVRIIYAPHVPMHGNMPAPIVRMPSGGAPPPAAPHSFPAAYFVQPMHAPPAARTPPLYNPTAHHSGPLPTIMSPDRPPTFPAGPYPTGSNPATPVTPVPTPPLSASSGPVWLPDATPPLPPPAQVAPRQEAARGQDAVAHSSDEEFTLTFLNPSDASEAVAAAGGRGRGKAATAAPVPALERNPWEPAARDGREVLVSNSVFDSAPLEALGCSMADGDCGMAAADDAGGSGGDLTASSCDECGYWTCGADEASDCPMVSEAAPESDASVLLDSALGSLVQASHSENFGDKVMQVTRTMTRVGCCLVQWHHKLEAAP